MNYQTLKEILNIIEKNPLITIKGIQEKHSRLSERQIRNIIIECIEKNLIHVRTNFNTKKLLLLDKGKEVLDSIYRTEQLINNMEEQ